MSGETTEVAPPQEQESGRWLMYDENALKVAPSSLVLAERRVHRIVTIGAVLVRRAHA